MDGDDQWKVAEKGNVVGGDVRLKSVMGRGTTADGGDFDIKLR